MTYQASKTDFTVDLLWWGSLRLAPIKQLFANCIKQKYSVHSFAYEYWVLFPTEIANFGDINRGEANMPA